MITEIYLIKAQLTLKYLQMGLILVTFMITFKLCLFQTIAVMVRQIFLQEKKLWVNKL